MSAGFNDLRELEGEAERPLLLVAADADGGGGVPGRDGGAEEQQQDYDGRSPHDPAAEWGDSGEMDWGAACASGPGEWQPPELLRVQARPIGGGGSG